MANFVLDRWGFYLRKYVPELLIKTNEISANIGANNRRGESNK